MLDNHSFRMPDTGTLLDESIWLFRKNFVLLVAISATVLVPYAVLRLGLGWFNPAPQPDLPGSLSEFMWSTLTTMGGTEQREGFLGWLYMLVFQPLATAAIVVAITERYAQRNVDARTSVIGAAPYLVTLSLAQILFGLIVVAVTIPAFLCTGLSVSMWTSQLLSQALNPTVTSAITIPMILAVLVGLTFLILPLLVSLRLAFISQLVVLEQLTPAKSIVRSWELTAGHSWHLLRISIATVLLPLLVVKLPIVVLSQLVVVHTSGSDLSRMFGTIINQLSDIVLFPFSVIVYTLLFYSLSLQATKGDNGYPAQQRPLVLPVDEVPSRASSS